MMATIVGVKSSKPRRPRGYASVAMLAHESRDSAHAVASQEICPDCNDTGWVRSIPNDHASARMTCKCRRRFGSTADA